MLWTGDALIKLADSRHPNQKARALTTRAAKRRNVFGLITTRDRTCAVRCKSASFQYLGQLSF